MQRAAVARPYRGSLRSRGLVVDNVRTCVSCNRPITSQESTRYCSLPCYRSRESSAPLVDRFWAKVDRRGPDECWEWTSIRTAYGYGMILTGPHGAQRKTRAHVLALQLDGRPLLHGQITLHSCDNPPCVNPAHLRGGTHSENLRDAWARTRRRKRNAAGASEAQDRLAVERLGEALG